MNCPKCSHQITDEEIARYFAAKGGSASTEAKRRSAAENGKKGGRPVTKREVKKEST